LSFKGYSIKKSLLIVVLFFIVVTLMSVLVNSMVSMIVTAVGMIVSGVIGLKIDSYAFVAKNDMYTRSKRMNGLILYMNYLMIFLGIVIIYQQIF